MLAPHFSCLSLQSFHELSSISSGPWPHSHAYIKPHVLPLILQLPHAPQPPLPTIHVVSIPLTVSNPTVPPCSSATPSPSCSPSCPTHANVVTSSVVSNPNAHHGVHSYIRPFPLHFPIYLLIPLLPTLATRASTLGLHTHPTHPRQFNHTPVRISFPSLLSLVSLSP